LSYTKSKRGLSASRVWHTQEFFRYFHGLFSVQLMDFNKYRGLYPWLHVNYNKMYLVSPPLKLYVRLYLHKNVHVLCMFTWPSSLFMSID